jgi:hypothetical protein
MGEMRYFIMHCVKHAPMSNCVHIVGKFSYAKSAIWGFFFQTKWWRVGRYKLLNLLFRSYFHRYCVAISHLASRLVVSCLWHCCYIIV